MLPAIYLIAAGMILCRGLFFAINNMGRHTALSKRLAWLVLTTGALDIVLAPAFGRALSLSAGGALLLAALACYLLRRRPAPLPSNKKGNTP